MDELDLRAIIETSYLHTDNTWRYRAILRYCFVQHERLHHYIYPEEIYGALKESPFFTTYSEEQLQQDLKQLVDWKNLIPRQETGRVHTIEDFKRKKFRYQCTPYTIEIERMVQRLQQLGSGFAGGSLEVTLFERLQAALLRFLEQGPTLEAGELNRTWEDLYGYFRDMVQNASDYLAHLKSDKVEEQMMTEAFVAYKNAFTQYLQNFILSMQRASFKIEALLKRTNPDKLMALAGKLADYQLTIPRMDVQPSREEWMDSYQDRYRSLAEWFLGRNGLPSELVTLQNETTDTIRRIARFAQRLGERHQAFRSRRHDYLHLAGWFAGLTDIGEAHKLSALLFGVAHSRHLYAEPRLSEDMEQGVMEELPTEVLTPPRVVGYREKSRPGALQDRTAEKQAALRAYIAEQRRQEQLIDQLIDDHKIVLADLPPIEPFVRKTLLNWIARCMQSQERYIQTETGRKIRLLADAADRRIQLKSTDGILEMPNFTLQFEERRKGGAL
ncbi:TIGR02677 family protein [Propionispora vibrioides]|uniref:TIGR02677 family protein n=1 Tax=Propionispora vibrioides TaxID=112903 RepID=A0A1H8XQ94_9FIRM|nr:TIGR02677 family protein [Propionispora vibrioides]SEP42065.1 TIGR02677 family protein [Propionispora vibrioides]